MTKREVREAARELGIPTWDKPASACLSSRIAFGVTITVEMLSKVGRAERAAEGPGVPPVPGARARADLVRVEVEASGLARLAEAGGARGVVAR